MCRARHIPAGALGHLSERSGSEEAMPHRNENKDRKERTYMRKAKHSDLRENSFCVS